MAHIEKRKTSKGEIRYRAQITLKGHPRVSETFSTRRAAQRWAERTTEAMRQRRFQPESEAEERTMGDVIERYIRNKLPHLAAQEETRRGLRIRRNAPGPDSSAYSEPPVPTEADHRSAAKPTS